MDVNFFNVDNEITPQKDFRVVIDNINQADEIFLDICGKQCATSYVTITYFNKKIIDTFNSYDIAYFLCIRDQLTSKTAIKQGKNVSFDFTLDEIFNIVYLHGNTFQFFENIEMHS